MAISEKLKQKWQFEKIKKCSRLLRLWAKGEAWKRKWSEKKRSRKEKQEWRKELVFICNIRADGEQQKSCFCFLEWCTAAILTQPSLGPNEQRSSFINRGDPSRWLKSKRKERKNSKWLLRGRMLSLWGYTPHTPHTAAQRPRLQYWHLTKSQQKVLPIN